MEQFVPFEIFRLIFVHNRTMSKFGERLKNERKLLKMSRRDLSSLLGISIRTVCYWESGQRESDFDTLVRISNILGVSTDYLLGKED